MTGGITIGLRFKQKIMLRCFMKAEHINTGGLVCALTLHRHQQTGALRACQTIISLSRLRAVIFRARDGPGRPSLLLKPIHIGAASLFWYDETREG